jgi:hypothetical protein
VRRGEADAYEHRGHGGRQDHLAQELEVAEAHRAGRLDQERIDVADRSDRVEQDGPGARVEHERDLRRLSDAK